MNRKKYIIFISTIIIIVSFLNVNASPGALQGKSIIKCPDGYYYGRHGADNHWHQAEKSNANSGWSAVGEIITAEDPCNKDSVLSFKDVKTYHWYYDSVREAYQSGIISGYSATKFGPNDRITRGQLVTIIWRMEGKPSASNIINRFTDVKNDYYTDAVKWASSNDIIHGYNAYKFGPNDSITRQDLAVILNNYARTKGNIGSVGSNLNTFADYNRVKGSYAEPALEWAVHFQIISGQNKNNKRYISPTSNTTRAEASAMIVNFNYALPAMMAAEDNTISSSNNQAAIQDAINYLSITAFSKQGLIDQLVYVGYSNSDATYGVNNCGANWNEQAKKKAISYLDISAFSYQGLIEQLKYEKFTDQEATYGASNCGANWYEQASKAAQTILKYSSYTRSQLIDYLVFQGFTQEQANYAATQNGK